MKTFAILPWNSSVLRDSDFFLTLDLFFDRLDRQINMGLDLFLKIYVSSIFWENSLRCTEINLQWRTESRDQRKSLTVAGLNNGFIQGIWIEAGESQNPKRVGLNIYSLQEHRWQMLKSWIFQSNSMNLLV